MMGLDRAATSVSVNAEIELINIGIKKKFKMMENKNFRDETTFSIGKDNINTIRVIKQKYNTSEITVDFSYPRDNKNNNLYPLTLEIEKEIVDNKILELIKEISLDNSITMDDLTYSYLEITTQIDVGSFYKYHNLVTLFYRSLIRKYDNLEGSVYSNYGSTMDKFYTTGFSFKPRRGWLIKLYSKLHQHNKNNIQKKFGAKLRLEHRITRNVLRNICGTNKVEDLTIENLKVSVKNNISWTLLELIKDELDRNEKILEKRFTNFKSRNLSNLIRDMEEWIFDEKIINSIITRNSKRSISQIERYRSGVKVALRESQIRSSPYRDNFENIERLELFINKLLLIKCEVKCKYKERLTFNFVEKSHKHEGFLT